MTEMPTNPVQITPLPQPPIPADWELTWGQRQDLELIIAAAEAMEKLRGTRYGSKATTY